MHRRAKLDLMPLVNTEYTSFFVHMGKFTALQDRVPFDSASCQQVGAEQEPNHKSFTKPDHKNISPFLHQYGRTVHILNKEQFCFSHLFLNGCRTDLVMINVRVNSVQENCTYTLKCCEKLFVVLY